MYFGFKISVLFFSFIIFCYIYLYIYLYFLRKECNKLKLVRENYLDFATKKAWSFSNGWRLSSSDIWKFAVISFWRSCAKICLGGITTFMLRAFMAIIMWAPFFRKIFAFLRSISVWSGWATSQ